MIRIFVGFVYIIYFLQLTTCDREHKVHNIVLYPERHSWCQTTAIKQVVAMPGYEPATIDNNVCVGACYSYSIPRTEPAEPGELIGPYCDSCQPVETKCYHVTLNASEDNKDGPKTVQKRVQIIMNCSCMSCEKTRKHDCEIADQNTLELPTDLFASLNINRTNPTSNEINNINEEIPELLNFVPPKNRTENSHNTTLQRYELNSNLIKLLKAIQEESDDENYSSLNYDKHQLKQLLDMVEGSEHQLSDKNLMDFVNFVNVHNSDDFELNLSKLKDVLISFREDQELIERHKSFGLGKIVLPDSATINANINSDLELMNKKYGGSNKNFGLEGSHLGMGHFKGSHIGMGITPNNSPNHIKVNNKNDDITTKAHHHMGEQQRVGIENGHLVNGPHGSLVFEPDLKVEEKLNIDSNMVKPNQEGLVISYVNHPKN